MSKFLARRTMKPITYVRKYLSKKAKDHEGKNNQNIFDPLTSAITVAEQTMKSMESLGRKFLAEAKIMNENMVKCSKDLNQKIVTEMESSPVKTNNPVESFLNRSNDIAPHIIQSSQTLTINAIDSIQRVLTEVLSESKKIVLSSNQITKSTNNKAVAMIDDIYYKSTITELWKNSLNQSNQFDDWDKRMISTDPDQNNKQLSFKSNKEKATLIKLMKTILDSFRKWAKEEKVVAIPPKRQQHQIYSKLNNAIRILQEIGKVVESAKEISEQKNPPNDVTLTPYKLQSNLDPTTFNKIEKNYSFRAAVREVITALQTIGQDPNYFNNLEKQESENSEKFLDKEQQEALDKIKLALNNVNDNYLVEILVKRINENINLLTTSMNLNNNKNSHNLVRVGRDYQSRAAAVEDAINTFLTKQLEPKEETKFKCSTENILKNETHKNRVESVEKIVKKALNQNLITSNFTDPKRSFNSLDFESRVVTAEKDTLRCLLQMRTLSEISQKEFDEAMAAIKRKKNNAYNCRLVTIINVLENILEAKKLKMRNLENESLNLKPLKSLKREASEYESQKSLKSVSKFPRKNSVILSIKPIGISSLKTSMNSKNPESLSKVLKELKTEGVKTMTWLMGMQAAENTDVKRLENLGKIPTIPIVKGNSNEMLKSANTPSSIIATPFRNLKESEKINNLELYFIERLLSVEQLIIRKIDGIQYRRLLGFDYTRQIQAVDNIIKQNLDNFQNEINSAVQTWSTYLPKVRRDKVMAQADTVKVNVKKLQLKINHELSQLKIMTEISAYSLEKTVKEGIKAIQEATFEVIRNAMEN